MTELSQRIFDTFQIRKSWSEKTEFIRIIQEHYPDAVVEEKTNLVKNRNIVIGDVSKAEVVLTAHYDTCAVLPFPNFITPNNMLVYILYNILILIPVLILMGVGINIGADISDAMNLSDVAEIIVVELCYVIPMLLFLYLLIFGPANRHTANDNTSGVIQLIELYENMTPGQREKCAFVFFDNEEKGMFGSMAFASMHKKIIKEKLIINFDCVSDGDFIFAVLDKRSEKYRETIESIFDGGCGKQPVISNTKKTFYPSDQKQFSKSPTIAVCALNRHKVVGYYMNKIHTNKDIAFDENNIRYLTEKITAFVERI